MAIAQGGRETASGPGGDANLVRPELYLMKFYFSLHYV